MKGIPEDAPRPVRSMRFRRRGPSLSAEAARRQGIYPSGGLTAGDVEACEDSLFTVGSGKSELISRFAPFDGFS